MAKTKPFSSLILLCLVLFANYSIVNSSMEHKYLNLLYYLVYNRNKYTSGASAISEGDIFIYSCSAQLISFEVDSISKEINCAEHEYMNMSPSLIALAPPLNKYVH